MAEWPFSQVAGALVVAHRGASKERPENTLAAFERAVQVGADAVELDVRSTADGVAVVLHDDELDRTTDGAGSVRERTVAEIARLHVAAEHRVPTLREALEAVSGRAAVDVEIKPPTTEDELRDVIEATATALDAFHGPVLVTSFDPAVLAAWAGRAPHVPTGLLAFPSVPLEAAATAARAGGHAWVLPPARAVATADAALVAAIRAAGLRLGVWVVDDPDDAVALMRLGVDAIATNDPATIVAARRAAFG